MRILYTATQIKELDGLFFNGTPKIEPISAKTALLCRAMTLSARVHRSPKPDGGRQGTSVRRPHASRLGDRPEVQRRKGLAGRGLAGKETANVAHEDARIGSVVPRALLLRRSA